MVKDSLSYWEKQSATYDGVLGVCSCLILTSYPSSDPYEPGGYGSGVRTPSYISASVKLI